MSDVEKNKLIIHTSWLFEAINVQYRSILHDVEKCCLYTQFKTSQMFGSFVKNLKLSSVLIIQGERNFTNIIKNHSLSQKLVQNVYNLYIKRSIYQERMAYEFLNNLKYDAKIYNSQELKKIYAKMYNLSNLLSQLDNNFFNFHEII